MTTYSWTGSASADFSNAANWIDASTGLPGAGVPGAADTIALSGAARITGTGTVSALDVLPSSNGHAYYVLDGAFSSRSVSVLGVLTVMQNGLLADSIDVGSAASGGMLIVQQSSVGALDSSLNVNVSDGMAAGYTAELDLGNPFEPTFGPGGTLSLGSGTLSVGAGVAQHGLVVADGVIAGGGSSDIIIGKDGGMGLLNAPNDPTQITAGRLVIGDSGTGSVNISLGGTLMLGSGHGVALALGAQDGTSTQASYGSLQGTNLTTTVDGAALVGETGQGSLSLMNASLTTLGGLIIGDHAGASGTVTLGTVAWADTGNVVIGASGSGSLLFSASHYPYGGFGMGTIDGDVRIGVSGGTGAVTLQGTTLTVAGNTVLGASASDSISLQYGTWNDTGHGVRLLGGPDGRPGNSTIMLSSDSTLTAGFLSIGLGDTVFAMQSSTIGLGVSASGTAASINGRLILDGANTLTAQGNVAIAHSFTNGAETGLQIYGGSAMLTSTSGFALSLVDQGVASVNSPGSNLTATGGILIADGGALFLNSGTVTAMSAGLALDVASGGNLLLQGGQLDTTGVLSINDSDRRPGQSTQGGLKASNGATLNSIAASPGGVAVAINGGFASLYGADWTVSGRMQVGANGPGGRLTADGSVVNISGDLHVGNTRSYGAISTGDTDTVISGGTLSAGQTGIAAASIVVGGDASSITTGTLEVGTTLSRGNLSISNGEVTASTASLNGVLRLARGGQLNAQTLTLAAHSAILGTGTLQASDIIVQGDIFTSQGSLICLGPITGAGMLHLGDGTLRLTQGEAASVGISFSAAGTLVTPSVADLAGKITGWQQGDAILFTGQAIASDSYANGTLSLFDGTHALLGTETFGGALNAGNFVLTSEQGAGTLLSFHR